MPAQRWLPGKASAWPGCILLALLACAFQGRADGGRDFSAGYEIGHATVVDPTHVTVKLFLRLENRSSADVSNATITLANNVLPGDPGVLVVSGITVARRKSVATSGTVTVATEEYQRWQRGKQPTLEIHTPDRARSDLGRPIELTRVPSLGARP